MNTRIALWSLCYTGTYFSLVSHFPSPSDFTQPLENDVFSIPKFLNHLLLRRLESPFFPTPFVLVVLVILI